MCVECVCVRDPRVRPQPPRTFVKPLCFGGRTPRRRRGSGRPVRFLSSPSLHTLGSPLPRGAGPGVLPLAVPAGVNEAPGVPRARGRRAPCRGGGREASDDARGAIGALRRRRRGGPGRSAGRRAGRDCSPQNLAL